MPPIQGPGLVIVDAGFVSGMAVCPYSIPNLPLVLLDFYCLRLYMEILWPETLRMRSLSFSIQSGPDHTLIGDRYYVVAVHDKRVSNQPPFVG